MNRPGKRLRIASGSPQPRPRRRQLAARWHAIVWQGLWPLLALSVLGGVLAVAGENQPLPRAHAHNDYEHPRPLLDALEQGFCSVEADIFLVEDRLLVAHTLANTTPTRTLEALYLDPLRERVRRHAGRVYPSGPEFTLLIDIKSDAERTYGALKAVLERYRGMLTEYVDSATRTNAVTVILSGNRPLATLAKEPIRLAALDGRLEDLQRNPSAALVPWVSDNWSTSFAWRGRAPLPADQRERLLRLVRQAHDQGRRIRFWGVPDQEVAWNMLEESGVDLINTDRLAELGAFLRKKPAGDSTIR